MTSGFSPPGSRPPARTGLRARWRSIWKPVALVAISMLAMPLQALLMRFTRGPAAFVLPRLWHRGVCRILGIRVEVLGAPRTGGATLFVGNHVSHFDIPLLGGILPARFIAKDEMAGWPGTPFVAGLQQTVFISRRARDAVGVARQLADVMQRGHGLVLFAEGTTSSGERVAPFKSSLFSLVTAPQAASGQPPSTTDRWTVQPFTIELTGVDGHALHDGGDRDMYAFHGDMDAGAHLRRFLQGRGARLRLHLHAPIEVTPDMHRKALAVRVHEVVDAALPSAPSPAG